MCLKAANRLRGVVAKVQRVPVGDPTPPVPGLQPFPRVTLGVRAQEPQQVGRRPGEKDAPTTWWVTHRDPFLLVVPKTLFVTHKDRGTPMCVCGGVLLWV